MHKRMRKCVRLHGVFVYLIYIPSPEDMKPDNWLELIANGKMNGVAIDNIRPQYITILSQSMT